MNPIDHDIETVRDFLRGQLASAKRSGGPHIAAAIMCHTLGLLLEASDREIALTLSLARTGEADALLKVAE